MLTEVAAGIVSVLFLTSHPGKKPQDACCKVHLIVPWTRSRCMWSRSHILREHGKQRKWESAVALCFPGDHMVQAHLLLSRRKASKSHGEFEELQVIRGIPGLLFLAFISGHEVGAWSQAWSSPWCVCCLVPDPKLKGQLWNKVSHFFVGWFAEGYVIVAGNWLAPGNRNHAFVSAKGLIIGTYQACDEDKKKNGD